MEVKLIHRPAFPVIGLKTWISSPDNEQFGRFWSECRDRGVLQQIHQIREQTQRESGTQTGGALLGLSWIENDPANRAFYYMIAVEAPVDEGASDTNSGIANIENFLKHDGAAVLEHAIVPEGLWAVFPCRGAIPESIMRAEMYAFNEWLPESQYQHAVTVEMEVYPPSADETYCEYWLQVTPR